MYRRDPVSSLIQATQALNEQLIAKNEKWISLLLWIGTDPRLSVDDLEREDYKRSPLECAVRSGNLAFIKKANLDPANDIVQLLFRNSWVPHPEVIEYLLSLRPDVAEASDQGVSLLESYISGLYYLYEITWNPNALDKAVACIVFLAKHGARWSPTDRSRLNHLRKALAKIDRYKAIGILEIFLAASVFGPGVFRILMATPTMKDLLANDTLRKAAGQKTLVDSRRAKGKRRRSSQK